jgi:hypothetical protein
VNLKFVASVLGPKARSIPAWGVAPGCIRHEFGGLKARSISSTNFRFTTLVCTQTAEVMAVTIIDECIAEYTALCLSGGSVGLQPHELKPINRGALAPAPRICAAK